MSTSSNHTMVLSSAATASTRWRVCKLYCPTTLQFYNYIPATNHVSSVHSVAAVLYLQSVRHVMLFRAWNMFCTSTLALPAGVCSVQYGCFLYYLNFVLSWYIALVMSERFWNGSSCPCYYRYHLCFHIPLIIKTTTAVVLLLLLLLLLIFVWGIYNYIPNTKHIPRIHNIAAELLLQYVPHMMLFPTKNVLYLHISTFPSTCTVPSA